MIFSGIIQGSFAKIRNISLQTPDGTIIRTRLAVTPAETAQGLSGVKSKDFRDDEGMLFLFRNDKFRTFWMPDTYFDLDIFFLDKNLNVLSLERSLKAHPGRNEPPRIARTGLHFCRYVLELKSGVPSAKKIKKGTRFKVISPLPLEQIESKIHRVR